METQFPIYLCSHVGDRSNSGLNLLSLSFVAFGP